jgi:hypothetical protein
VPPERVEDVIFTIKTSNLQLLAEALLEISYGYVNGSGNMDLEYHESVVGVSRREYGRFHLCTYMPLFYRYL